MNSNAKITDRKEREYLARRVIMNDTLEFMPKLEQLAKKFEGKKWFKVDGTKTAAFKSAFDELIEPFTHDSRRIWINGSGRSHYIAFDYWHTFGVTTDNIGSKTSDGAYYRVDFYIGDALNGTMPNTWDPINEACKLARRELELKWKILDAKREAIKRARKSLSSLEDGLPYWMRR